MTVDTGIIENKYFREICGRYKKFSQTKAIGIGGSSAAKTSDLSSDIDLYVFTDKDIPVKDRLELAKEYSSKYETGSDYFGQGDEFFVDKMGRQLDVMYFNTDWFEKSVNDTWEKHQAQNGYTTCFLYTLKNLEIICDTNNWLKGLQSKLSRPYPKELKDNIIQRNMMLMKDKPFASYYEQIEKAVKRDDKVSVGHRISAFLASYFDVLFAKNELLHPGEKRLIKFSKDNCKKLPDNFEENITNLLTRPNPDTMNILDNIVENIRKI